MYKILATISIETITAPTKYGFVNNFISNIECLSDLHSNTWKSCDITKVHKARVLQVAKSNLLNLPVINASNVQTPIKTPLTVILDHSPLANILSPFSLGCWHIISLSGGSTPRAMAGKPSVAKFTNNIWIGVNGFGR